MVSVASPRMPGNMLKGVSWCASGGDRKLSHPTPPMAISTPRTVWQEGRSKNEVTDRQAIESKKYQALI